MRSADPVVRLIVVLFGLTLTPSACSPPAEEEPESGTRRAGPSILVVTLDTTRADHLGCYGRELARTPNIDALATQSVRFDCAQSVAPLTAPAHASLFSGLYPPRHGVRENGSFVLPAEVQTMAESLEEAGYRTGAIVAAVVLDDRYGLEQGFEHYSSPRSGQAQQGMYVSADAADVTRRATEWLADGDDRPFFLWVHYWDAHQPYAPPPEFRIPGATDYDGEIHRVDHHLGQLLTAVEALPQAADLMTVLVADHGEALGFKGELSHSYYAYGPQLRIPLLLRYPDGRDAGQVRREVVSIVDVLPTVLHAVDLEAAEVLDGIRLGDADALARRGEVYVESAYPWFHHRWSPIVGLVGPDTRYYHSSQPELYRLAADGEEDVDVAGQEPELVARLEARVAAILAAPGRVAPRHAVDSGTIASLRALGYLTGATSQELPPLEEWTTLVSPTDFRPRIERFFEATTPGPGWSRGKAVTMLRDMVAEDPSDLAALDQLARFLIDARRYQDAAVPLRQLIAEDPLRTQALGNLGAVLQASRRFDEALEVYAQALELDPGALNVLQNMIAILDHLDRDDEAELYREELALRRGDG